MLSFLTRNLEIQKIIFDFDHPRHILSALTYVVPLGFIDFLSELEINPSSKPFATALWIVPFCFFKCVFTDLEVI